MSSTRLLTLLGNQRQHPRIGKKVVLASQRRKLITPECAEQRKVAQRLLNVGGIDAGHSIERVAARAAVKIEAESGFSAL